MSASCTHAPSATRAPTLNAATRTVVRCKPIAPPNITPLRCSFATTTHLSSRVSRACKRFYMTDPIERYTSLVPAVRTLVRSKTMETVPLPGAILLGKYRVEQVLGQGGMGAVVAVRHVHLGELFAIKLMLPAVLTHHEAVERFVREARASARLKGEHVARVHDVGSLENGAPYMLMEHLAGEDLKEVLKGRGALPLDEAALYVYQACEAVAEAHSHGIVHRDLKPANMFLIRRPNGTPCVKVLDFGISKEMDSANKLGPDLTKTGTFMGSPFYMSPEHMANIKTTEPRSDIWALGVILYEFATGSKPFVAEAMTELVTKVLTTQPIPPSMVRPGIPPEFDAIVLRCLEKNREHRFASVRDLMTALQPFTAANTLQYTMIGVQPDVAPRPEMKSNAGTVLLPNRPGVEGADVPPPTLANAWEQQPNPAIAPEPANKVAGPAQGSHTGGAWAKTSITAPRKNKKTFVVASAALGAIALIGMGMFVATRTTTTPPTGASAAAAAMPLAVAEAAAPDKASVTPAPESAQSAAVSNSAVPTTSTPPSQTAAAPATPTAASPTSRPASTSTKKKPVIADFDN